MSIKLNLATGVFALAVASLSAQGSAVAGSSCNGQWFRDSRGLVQCYFLPTVSGGTVTGLQLHVNRRGAVVGGVPVGHHRWW